MDTLGIQERKLNIIEQLIILNDDEVFRKVEELINKSLRRPDLNRFSVSDLKRRAEQANRDIFDGNLYSQDDVEEQTKSWNDEIYNSKK